MLATGTVGSGVAAGGAAGKGGSRAGAAGGKHGVGTGAVGIVGARLEYLVCSLGHIATRYAKAT